MTETHTHTHKMRESYFRGNIKWGSKHKGVCKKRIIGGAKIRGGSKGGKRINIDLKNQEGVEIQWDWGNILGTWLRGNVVRGWRVSVVGGGG